MKKTTKILSVLLALTFIFSSMSLVSFADDGITRYYIDSIDGDDANSGISEAEAVKTIAGLKSEVKPGAHFLFRNGGRYECAVTFDNISGTKENPIVISSYGEGEKAILYTNKATEVFRFFDSSYITVSDIAITAPNAAASG